MNQLVCLILCFTLPFLMTTLGACLVFFFNKTSRLISMITIGFAAGIMLSASIFSLLIPALENAQESLGNLSFLPVVIGFLLGAVFMVLLDIICARFFKKDQNLQQKRSFKLFTAITIHNIPEGLSVGFAIGTAMALGNPVLSAFMFALGIALQNFPEGLATALPMLNSTHSRPKAFLFGTLSGLVEPIFAILGFFLSAYITALLPWLLAFSAGAMIYVIVQEMVPEIHMEGSCSWGTWAFVLGFVVMMLLDICL